jgi:hypothetical protein
LQRPVVTPYPRAWNNHIVLPWRARSRGIVRSVQNHAGSRCGVIRIRRCARLTPIRACIPLGRLQLEVAKVGTSTRPYARGRGVSVLSVSSPRRAESDILLAGVRGVPEVVGCVGIQLRPTLGERGCVNIRGRGSSSLRGPTSYLRSGAVGQDFLTSVFGRELTLWPLDDVQPRLAFVYC